MIRKKYSLYILLASMPIYIHAMEKHTEKEEKEITEKADVAFRHTKYSTADLDFVLSGHWLKEDPRKLVLLRSYISDILNTNPELANKAFAFNGIDGDVTPLAATIYRNLEPAFNILLNFCLPPCSKPLIDVNCIFNINKHPNLAIFIAVRLQRFLMLQSLLTWGAWVNIPQTYASLFKIAPLDLAEDPDIRALLLQYGAKPYQPDYSGEDLYKAIFPKDWQKAFDSDRDMMTDKIVEVQHILRTNPDLASIVFPEINLTPLAATARANLVALFNVLLTLMHPHEVRPIIDVNQVFGDVKDRNTALLEAIRQDRAVMVEELIKYGAWVTVPKEIVHQFNLTPFQESIMVKHEIFKLLLDHGADPLQPSVCCPDLAHLSDFIHYNRAKIPHLTVGMLKTLLACIPPSLTPVAPRKSEEER